MKLIQDARVDKAIRSLPKQENAKIIQVIDLFLDCGFSLSALFLKKLTTTIWELRAGNWRLLFGKINGEFIIVHMFRKSTQKTPKSELEKATLRLEAYKLARKRRL